ncbi:hypothetical protein [Nocardioides bizhenqiangii]|uniref:Uncharacterized protein n=1 Tax=Nocardioides bizhenqiangii TaxID=3095076 RepID=A0ABZ0ZSZ3_9ACTN|nr:MULTISPECIES: hypothetical protein [unclassified Nocardioides]MDZ5619361.1 hypothetical protein [Nocardioides sp. HM23]WQQ26618.1 hypothetical protein SHK19_22020 [Nocardioides sp. HM61]
MTTDEPDEQLDPASPEDEARIRALLSGARTTDPMPADVAARLDDVLIGLAAERATLDPVPADNVVPIARTRRHRVVAVLGAAAAVAVFGLAVGAVVNGDSGEDAGSSAETAVERGGDDGAALEEPAPSEAAVEDDSETEDQLPGNLAYRKGDRPYAVRSGQLSRDLAAIQERVLVVPADADYERSLVYAPQDFPCRLPQLARGVLVGVRYDDGPAFVRFLEPMGDSQVVEVLQCGTGDLLRSTTLPTQG